jgi:succinate dehydrogenase / fumarate reductase iron-sulfur subunit
MNIRLKVWRQQKASVPGIFVEYQVSGVTPEMSFLEMLDLLNEDLLRTAILSRWNRGVRRPFR